MHYALAVVIPPSISCCAKHAQHVVFSDLFDKKHKHSAFLSFVEDYTKRETDLGSIYCPRLPCGIRLSKSLPRLSVEDSAEEIVNCPSCLHDMCITCNNATHPPGQPCLSDRERLSNIGRMGLMHCLDEPSFYFKFMTAWDEFRGIQDEEVLSCPSYAFKSKSNPSHW